MVASTRLYELLWLFFKVSSTVHSIKLVNFCQGSVNADDDNAEQSRKGKKSEQDYEDEEDPDDVEADEGIEEGDMSDELLSDDDNEKVSMKCIHVLVYFSVLV